ncbi:MAG: transglutaminase family protein [Sphaerochaeta sp.]
MEEERMEAEAEAQHYLNSTALLDYDSPVVTELIQKQGWLNLSSPSDRIAEVYGFVRDEIPFGYAKRYYVPASEVVREGMGNCITKTTLLMALLRAVGIPCRLRAGMISKVIHRGLLKGLSFSLSPRHLHHTWVEVYYQNRWLEIGGHIVDKPYLEKLQLEFSNFIGTFYGYGIAVSHFRNPPIRWEEEDTSIQSKAVRESLSTFNDPDSFFQAHPEAEQRTKSLNYRFVLRPTLNRSIRKLRSS